MTGVLLSGGVAFVVALILGGPSVQFLKRYKFGKAISEDLPDRHASKAGTPTMGGLFIWLTVVLVTIFTNLFEFEDSFFSFERQSMILPLSVVSITLAVGIWDDLGTLINKPDSSLSWRFKFIFLTAISAGVSACMFYVFEAESVFIPWLGKYSIGYFYLAIAFLTIFSTTTAVSITDGLDGLLGGTALFSFGAYGIIAYSQGQLFLSIFCFTVAGALLGFLWYNAHPALVFMGDAGALPLGAALGTVALMTGHWLLLPIIGIVFVIEATSDVIQVGYFKITKGKRIFRKTPFHHHLELLGWSEPQVVMRLYLFGIAGALVGIALALTS
jgi:phospho-N-acetylmuramoyl-pentapeptide-transferase